MSNQVKFRANNNIKKDKRDMLELLSTIKFLVFFYYPSVFAFYILVLIYCTWHMRV